MKEILRETEIDGVRYVCPSWEEMREQEFFLAKKINDSGQKFDRLVALAKGGWTWARVLMDHVGIENLSSMRLKSYEDVNLNAEVRVLQPLADSVDRERVLIFDDVADSGKTLIKAKEYMNVLGCKDVAIATLCFKPRSCVSPDYSAFETTSWVVFPHEHFEFMGQSVKKWSGVSSGEIRSRFEEIGVPTDEVSYFMSREGFSIE